MKQYSQKLLSIMILITAFCLSTYAVHAGNRNGTAPKKLFLNETNLTLYTGNTKLLAVRRVEPAQAWPHVIWKSSDPKVVSVSKNGKLRAKKPGKASVTAISTKSSKSKVKVKIVVLKHPKRVEKRCSLNGAATSLDFSSVLQWTDKIISSKTELQTAFKECESYMRSYGQERAMEIKRFLTKYKKTNFKKKTIMILYTSLSQAEITEIQSLETHLDSSGKLRGTVVLQCRKKNIPPGTYVTAASTPYWVFLEMNKRDLAMIDYFKFEHNYTE